MESGRGASVLPTARATSATLSTVTSRKPDESTIRPATPVAALADVADPATVKIPLTRPDAVAVEDPVLLAAMRCCGDPEAPEVEAATPLAVRAPFWMTVGEPLAAEMDAVAALTM